MLPKKFRITVTRFNQIPQKTKELNLFFLKIKLKGKADNNDPRFAVLVGKALDARSSRRHLSKRIVIEAVRKEIGNIKIPINMLLKAKKIINKKDRATVENEIKYLFKKAQLL